MAALKGAFIKLGAGLLGALPNIVVFQFNPDRVTRTPRIPQPPQPSTGAGNRAANQQPGQPAESMSFSLRIDATDQLAQSNPVAAASGILPTLSALELLMVPASSPEPAPRRAGSRCATRKAGGHQCCAAEPSCAEPH